MATLVLHETNVCQLGRTRFTFETFCVPIITNGLNNSSNDEFTTSLAARRVQYVKIAFTIFTSAEFIVDAVFKFAKTLCTPEIARKQVSTFMLPRLKVSLTDNKGYLHKAFGVPNFSVRVDYSFTLLETATAMVASHRHK